MKKVLTFLILFSLLSGMSMAMDLTGKTGIGLRADSLSIRRFISNNFALDLSLDYFAGTRTGQADNNNYDYALGGYWVKEVFKDVLFEAGATVEGWHGFDAGAYFNGVGFNPFVGAECFINEHFAVDGKIFITAYNSEMKGTARKTDTTSLSGNLGAHIYL